MMISILIAIYITGYYGIMSALIGIGLGWNTLYVGSSSLVAILPGDAHKLQGINKLSVAVLNIIGAFSAGLLFAIAGWVNSNWIALILLMLGVILLLINSDC